MMEANTFRVVLAMGGLMVVAAAVVLIFIAPVVPIAPSSVDAFERIMNKDIGSASAVTAYDALWYAVKGWIRGDISHY